MQRNLSGTTGEDVAGGRTDAPARGRSIHGVVRPGKRTKLLTKTLEPGQIALIDHKDIDRVSGEELVRKGVSCVINVAESSTGDYPNTGPQIITGAGVHLVDAVDSGLFDVLSDGDEIVLDGFYQGDPNPLDTGAGDKWQRAFRFLALDRMQARLHRWRLNLVTGQAREEPLSDTISEFGMINPAHSGESYRYAYAATGKPGWFLFDGLVRHDVVTGNEQRISFGDGVYGSETAMAPRVGSHGEDDGYLVTLTTDMNDDASYCLVFDAARIEDGPVCKLLLPERISSGTHSTWVAGSELRRWRETDTAAAAVGLG